MAGHSHVDLTDQALLLVQEGQLDIVLSLLREAVRCYPGDADLRNMLAFNLIPIYPEESLRPLARPLLLGAR